MEDGKWNMEYKKFEETEVWRLSKEVAVKIYRLTSNFDKKDFALIDQMRRSAISISSNIAEGYERNSKKELAQFLNIAKGSVGELRSQLTIASELGLINFDDFNEIILLCEKISKQLKGFMRFLERSHE
jgi:four helix bundle protein